MWLIVVIAFFILVGFLVSKVLDYKLNKREKYEKTDSGSRN